MSREADPYYSVRDIIQGQLEKIKAKNEKFHELVRTTDTSSNSEFKELRKNLVKDLRAADKDLRGLREAVDSVDRNRAKFPNIKDGELNARKKFVEDANNTITSIKAKIDSPEVRRKIEDDENRARRAMNPVAAHYEDKINSENTNFVRDQKLQTKSLLAEQDVAVTKLGSAVDRLGQVGKGIQEELIEQGALLDNLETEVNEASGRLGQVQLALGKLLKTKDSCQIWTVVILTLILIILVALVIWT